MSVLDVVRRAGQETVRFGSAVQRVQDTGYPHLAPLSVFLDGGVVPRETRSDNRNELGSDLAKYQRVAPGDMVFNKLRTWQGGFGFSRFEGIVSPAYFVCRPQAADGRFLDYLLHSRPYLSELTRLSKWMPPSQFDISWADLKAVAVVAPGLPEQRRIAGFLDDQVSRIDRIIATRRRQIDVAAIALESWVWDRIRGAQEPGPRRPTALAWLGDVPETWPVLPVSSQYETALGKMLDEARSTGQHPLNYLRNTNVQWDRVDLTDVKSMDIEPSELGRFTLRAGDLLICEGGQPGRAAMWDGAVSPMGFQKALHRARTRGRSRQRWLLHCLRAAVGLNVFAGENGQTTISHLTGEQLRSQRFPFPESTVQDRLVGEMDRGQQEQSRRSAVLNRSIELLAEYKQSLITAAVTGEFDVTAASGRGAPA